MKLAILTQKSGFCMENEELLPAYKEELNEIINGEIVIFREILASTYQEHRAINNRDEKALDNVLEERLMHFDVFEELSLRLMDYSREILPELPQNSTHYQTLKTLKKYFEHKDSNIQLLLGQAILLLDEIFAQHELSKHFLKHPKQKPLPHEQHPKPKEKFRTGIALEEESEEHEITN